VRTACYRLDCSNTVQEGEAEELTLRLDRLKKTEKDRIRQIKALEQEIVRTREELAKPPDVKPEKAEDLAAEMVCHQKLHLIWCLCLMGQQRQLTVERQGVLDRKGALDDKIKSNIDNRAKFSTALNYAHGE